MPIHGSRLDDGDDDHNDDGKNGIVAKRAQQGRSGSKSFDERFKDLMDFQQKFGHCDVPRNQYVEYMSLGKWCAKLRISYKTIQNRKTPAIKLTEEYIRQLEDSGFKWSLSTYNTFDEWYAELMKYKEKFRHCKVPKRGSGEYQSLGNWRNKIRTSYNKIQKKETPHIKITEENIRQLQDAGFKWSLRQSMFLYSIYCTYYLLFRVHVRVHFIIFFSVWRIARCYLGLQKCMPEYTYETSM